MITCDVAGDLAPLYVTGALGPAIEAAVRAHLAACDQPHDEVAEMGGAALALLETVEPVEPPPGLRTRLLAAAAADLETGRHPASRARPTAVEPGDRVAVEPGDARSTLAVVGGRSSSAPTLAPLVPPARRSPWMARSMAIAAGIAILVLGGLGLSLRRELDGALAQQAAVERALELAGRPGSQAGLIAADGGGASGLGVVGTDGTVLLAMRGLPATHGSAVYTAWMISGNDAPVPVGEFTVGADGTAVAVGRTAPGSTGITLAVTLEPGPGATTPTLPIIAKGVTR